MRTLLLLGVVGIATQPSASAPQFVGASFKNPDRLIEPEDFPSAAVRRGEQGRVRVAVGVTPDAKFASCSVTRSSGSALLDDTACRAIQRRARFRPAIIDGHPAASAVTTVISFLLFPDGVAPTTPPPSTDFVASAPEPSENRQASMVTIDRRIRADGTVVDCRVSQGGGNAVHDALACREAGWPTVERIRDRSGIAIEGVLTETILFR